MIRHLPDPPLRLSDSDTVDASGEAYVLGRAPDDVLGAASAAATTALAVWGGTGRERPRLLRVLTAAKVVADAAAAVVLFVEQLRMHRRLCSWCTAASVGRWPRCRSLCRTRSATPVASIWDSGMAEPRGR